MKTIGIVILAAGFIFLPQPSHAQTAQPVPANIVSITAVALSLPLVPPDQVPPFVTWWLIQPGSIGAVPLPCPPDNPTWPIFAITPDGQQLLVDGTIWQVLPTTASAASALLAAQANAVVNLVNLIAQIQTVAVNQPVRAMARAMGADDLSPPGAGGGGDGGGSSDFTNSYSTCSFDTNILWISVENVANGIAYANLHNATNLNGVYAIWSSMSLATPFSQWQVETEVWPTDTNCMPFMVPTLNRDTLFLRAQDWTGVDSDQGKSDGTASHHPGCGAVRLPLRQRQQND